MRKKHQFKSYYCGVCKQRKPCGKLTNYNEQKNYCCPCLLWAGKRKKPRIQRLPTGLSAESTRTTSENSATKTFAGLSGL